MCKSPKLTAKLLLLLLDSRAKLFSTLSCRCSWTFPCTRLHLHPLSMDSWSLISPWKFLSILPASPNSMSFLAWQNPRLSICFRPRLVKLFLSFSLFFAVQFRSTKQLGGQFCSDLFRCISFDITYLRLQRSFPWILLQTRDQGRELLLEKTIILLHLQWPMESIVKSSAA